MVDEIYPINKRSDFDVCRSDFLPDSIISEAFRDYLVFCWVLLHGDVIITFFDGGFLKNTWMRRVELPLLKLCNRRVIVTPYGGDIAVRGYLAPFEEPMARDYPGLLANSEQIRRRVDHFATWADLIVRNMQVGYLPRFDVTWPSMLAIDTREWDGAHFGHDSAVTSGERPSIVVTHAPNHRAIKMTESVIAAVAQLQGEGLDVRLDLLERRPNEEVQKAIESCDIVAEQFVGGYAQFAIEGMASHKPVLSRLGWLPDDIRSHPDLQACPIVDTRPEELAGTIRSLAMDSARREELGHQGREYVLRHHSEGAVGAKWDSLIRHVCLGEDLPSYFRQP